MARQVTINDKELLERLSIVFRDSGYHGASLNALAEASGLKKASLYHRFPGGKEQMAHEALEMANKWLEEHILSLLQSNVPPEKK